MSKAEKFISEHTRNYSNAIYDPYDTGDAITIYASWLTQDDVRKAVEIAREEMIDKTLAFLKKRLYKDGYIGIIDLCDDYIKAMKYE